MSELRIAKRRVTATVTLSAGAPAAGALFLADQAATHAGPERLIDVLNAGPGFVPFEAVSPVGERYTQLLNLAHIVVVQADRSAVELADDAAYQAAPKKSVVLQLLSGEELRGVLRVERPAGRDRLSDAVRDETGFRYLESASGVLAVNLAHVVRITPVAE
jgi:hypothetical protein